MNMTPSQQRAIDSNAPAILVVAGAGSGKTSTVVQRNARLIAQGESPDSILCLTFTRKAANELKERLEKLIGPQARRIWAGTFHAISYRILRQWGERIGYQTTGGRTITVVTPDEAESVFKAVIDQYGWKGRKSTIEEARKELAHRGEFPEDLDLARIIREYWAELRRMNAVDYDQLLLEVSRLFRESPEALAFYRNRFAHIFVDEYQDTDLVQYNLHEMLAPAHLFCVGDPDQAIYGWRGADMSIILRFEQAHPGAEVVLLEECFRCAPPIVEAANRLIAHNRDRIPKTLLPQPGEGSAEARKDWSPVYRLSEDLAFEKPEEVAVIARTHADLEKIERECIQAGLSVFRVGAEEKTIGKSAIMRRFKSHLRLWLNSRDDLAMHSLDLPAAEIQAAMAARRSDQSLFEAWRARLSDDGRLTLEAIRHAFDEAPSSVAAFAAFSTVAGSHPQEMLLNYLADNGGELKPAEWIEREMVKDMHAGLERKRPDRITLLTAHAAKGLEWDHVLVIGMEDGKFPSQRAIRAGTEEEERRLAYVAFTRARKTLAIYPIVDGATPAGTPSRFIKEAGL